MRFRVVFTCSVKIDEAILRGGYFRVFFRFGVKFEPVSGRRFPDPVQIWRERD